MKTVLLKLQNKEYYNLTLLKEDWLTVITTKYFLLKCEAIKIINERIREYKKIKLRILK